MPQITYDHDRVVHEDDLNLTILDISRKHNIPHTSACGGNARCSTCRVLVLDQHENVLPCNDAERELALQKGLEPDIRLACQTRVSGPVTIRRLVLDEGDLELACTNCSHTTGREVELAVMFSDIRNFTSFAETHLSYDVVHILNRYFHQMGSAIFAQQGYIDKYLGDGIMALFGLETKGAKIACRNAVLAGLGMLENLVELNRYLLAQFGTTFEMGIGIHFGTVLVADMGHPDRMQFTAIGDVVNVASRIETATKQMGVQLLVSETVHSQLEGELEIGQRARLPLKGKSGAHMLYEVQSVVETLSFEQHVPRAVRKSA